MAKKMNLQAVLLCMCLFVGCSPRVGSGLYPDFSDANQTEEESAAYRAMRGETIQAIEFVNDSRMMILRMDSGKSIRVMADAPAASLLKIELRTEPFGEPVKDFR